MTASIEYTMICVDDSQFMRNGDIRPNRLRAELDAINVIAHHVISARVENRVGILTLSACPQVLQPLTNNEVNLLRKLYSIKTETLKEEIHLVTGIKTALLTVKFVKKTNAMSSVRLRILAFVGSPFNGEQSQLDSLVDDLNKAKVSVDIVCFGSENSSKHKMFETFVAKLKTSNFIVVPNDKVMANVLAESPIMSSNRTVSLVNENIDPELAMAMKMSTEDHNTQFEADMKRAIEASTIQSDKSQSKISEEEENLQKAIDMSMEFMKKNDIPVVKHNDSSKTQTETQGKYMSEEEQLAMTLQMSLMQNKSQSKSGLPNKQTEQTAKSVATDAKKKRKRHSKKGPKGVHSSD